MNGTVREWVEKAEGDFRTARREFEAVNEPNFDSACFHAQQGVEKLMKAVLIHNKVEPPRIHHLERLYELLLPLYPKLSLDVEQLRDLTSVGMAVRYPGETADREDATTALAICERVRRELKKLLESP